MLLACLIEESFHVSIDFLLEIIVCLYSLTTFADKNYSF